MLLHKGIGGRGLQEMMLLKLWVPSKKAADTVFSPLPCQVLTLPVFLVFPWSQAKGGCSLGRGKRLKRGSLDNRECVRGREGRRGDENENAHQLGRAQDGAFTSDPGCHLVPTPGTQKVLLSTQ